MKRTSGKDCVKASSTARLVTVREADVRALVPGYDRLNALGRLRATRSLLQEDAVSIRQEAVGRNKVLLQGITKTLEQFQNGTPYKLTHVDVGTSTVAVDEAQTGVQAHVDAETGVARIDITEKSISGKQLRTSSFVTSSQYNGSTIAEAALCDALTGGTPYNRVLFTTTLAKVSTDTAILNIDHTLNN